MDAGRIIGACVAGAGILSGCVIGVRALYVKVLEVATPKPAFELPPIVLPPPATLLPEETNEEG